jgi:signal transduction histidine kinase
MSLEERLRQAGSAVEALVAARIDTAKLLVDLRRREGVATLRPVAVGVGASTGSIAAPGRMEEFARAVVGGDPIAVQQFERAVLRPVEPQSNRTPQGKRGNDVNVIFAYELRRRLAALRVLSEAIEVRTAEAEVDRLVNMLVQELRDLEQLESAMASPRRDVIEDVDVIEIAQSAAQTVSLVRKSPIVVQGFERSLRIRSNPTMLRQALENLIDNGASCGSDAPVEVVVRYSVARRVPGIEVLVADRGPCLGRTPASRRSGGSVGLQLVRKFVQEAGGRLWSHNRQGGGALFGLWLPTGRLSALGHE